MVVEAVVSPSGGVVAALVGEEELPAKPTSQRREGVVHAFAVTSQASAALVASPARLSFTPG
jgi:hypothetical protein